MEEVKRIGSAEPSNSAYHIRRMELIEELNNLEEKLQNNEERDVLVKYNYLPVCLFFPLKKINKINSLSQ